MNVFFLVFQHHLTNACSPLPTSPLRTNQLRRGLFAHTDDDSHQMRPIFPHQANRHSVPPSLPPSSLNTDMLLLIPDSFTHHGARPGSRVQSQSKHLFLKRLMTEIPVQDQCRGCSFFRSEETPSDSTFLTKEYGSSANTSVPFLICPNCQIGDTDIIWLLVTGSQAVFSLCC